MLLIGSRASRVHFPDSREPRGDVDLIATPAEADALASVPGCREDAGPHEGKRDFVIDGIHVEVEVALPGSTAEELLPHSSASAVVPPVGFVDVASPDVLFLLKRSHVAFRLHWTKSFRDHKFLQSKGCHVPSYLSGVLSRRIEETKRRLRFSDRDFDVTNGEFFERSAGAVRRFMPHDEIHEAVKFGPVPMFKVIKEEQGMAQISWPLFDALSFQEKIWNMQEECMVLTCERHVFPAVVDGGPYSERKAAKDVLRGMCCNYLPFDFRFFAIDFFDDIYDSLPWGFSDGAVRALARHLPEVAQKLHL